MARSTYPGGAADKAGNNHEALWGVCAMLDLLEGKATSMRIEPPLEDGSEFYLDVEGKREFWQAKRQLSSQNAWTIKKLSELGVIRYFYQKYLEGHTCVFASTIDAPNLARLIENAKASVSFEEFKENFLSRQREVDFESIQRHLETGNENAYSFLKAIRLQRSSEDTLEEHLRRILEYRYGGDGNTTLALLRDFYLQSVHDVLTSEVIEKYLLKHNIRLREIESATVRDRIDSITTGYSAEQCAKLIGGQGVPRQLARDVVEEITSSNASMDVLITSEAGGGKSACMHQIVEGLRGNGIPVLAFRLDRIEPVATTIMLGRSLELPHSPAFVLEQAYPEQPVVVVLDQVDCVSTSSGRRVDFFDVLAALCREIYGLRFRSKIHLVLACRKFDFDNDSRLKQLLPKGKEPRSLKRFSEGEVKGVLCDNGVDPNVLNGEQLKLLQLPQHLSLYLQSGLKNGTSPFASTKDLFDAYWKSKRAVVSREASELDQHWLPAIKTLTSYMSDAQQLSAPLRVLDEYPPIFIDRLVSEGVLTVEQKRYGFSHELLFDYCFARTQPNGGREFVGFLENDAQKLFRRAQLRQVLAFLRDEDFAAYIESISSLLNNIRIRPHLKLTAVDLLCSQIEPREEELALLMPWVEDEWPFLRNGSSNPNKLSTRIWERLFSSRSLFPLVDKMGYLEAWLNSGEEWLENIAASYLRWQTDQHADRVAELLEPFVHRNEAWNMRLRAIAEWRDRNRSRRLFNLFLRLLDEGILDDARDRFVSNGTFWSMLYGLADERPAWCAEVAAHWLDRRVVLTASEEESKRNAWSYIRDMFGGDEIVKCAEGDPHTFLKHVLPSVLKAAETFKYSDDSDRYVGDSLWPARHISDHGVTEAFLVGCEKAFSLIAEQRPEALREYIDQLLPVRLYTANHLLLYAYQCAKMYYADEAIRLIAGDSGRLLCGYADSAYWLTRQLIENCSPYASDEAVGALESTLLGYKSLTENSREGFKWRGHAAYIMISAMPEKRLTAKGRGRVGEWKVKFGGVGPKPRGIRSYTVVSPIGEESAARMTDTQWLRAISKYNTEERLHDWNNPEKGGGSQLAFLLGELVKKSPLRFAHLCLRFPQDTLGNYYASVMRGLMGADIDDDLKVQIVMRIKDSDHYDVLVSALDLLGSIKSMRLPDTALEFITDMASHDNPEFQSWEEINSDGGLGVYDRGLNSVRGRAAEAMKHLIFEDESYLGVFESSIQKLSTDPSPTVRALAAGAIYAVASVDEDKAISLFGPLIEPDIRILTTGDVVRFMRWALHNHFSFVSGTVLTMLESEYDEVREEAGILAGLSNLYHPEAKSLVDLALSHDAKTRLGVGHVAAANLADRNSSDWCMEVLPQLFNDDSDEVRKAAGDCFRTLWKSPDTPLADYEGLIEAFRTSRSLESDPTTLLYALESTRQRVPRISLDICEEFVSRCAEQSLDLSSSMASDEHTIGKIVFAAYTQLQEEDLQTRALDIIDRMCLEGLRSVHSGLSEIER